MKPLPLSLSVLIHGAVLFGMTRLPEQILPKHNVVQVAVKNVTRPPPPPEPPPPEPPPPPPPPIPRPEVVPKKVKTLTVKEVVPNEPPPSPEPPPPPPQGFSVDMSNTVGSGAVAVPAVVGGGNMFANPNDGLAPGKKTTAPPPPPVGQGTGGPAGAYQITQEARFLSSVEERTPPYPREAKQLEIEGTVVIRAYVDETGRVKDVKVLKKLGYGCDEIAIKWAREKWRFQPAKAGDKPVGMWITFPVQFVLDR